MKYWQLILENIQDAYSLILIILIIDITYVDFYPVTYFWIHLICLQVFVALVSASDLPVSPLFFVTADKQERASTLRITEAG